MAVCSDCGRVTGYPDIELKKMGFCSGWDHRARGACAFLLVSKSKAPWQMSMPINLSLPGASDAL